MWHHLLVLTWAEWRHHPGRHAVALLAVALGVALAASVQIINASALAEFAQAVRAVNGQPDAVLAARQRDGFDDALYARLAQDEAVAALSPVLELEVLARRDGASAAGTLRLAGIDPLTVAGMAPALLPRPASAAEAGDRGVARLFDPEALYLNPAARQALGAGLADGAPLWLRGPDGWLRFRIAGSVAAPGAPLAVLDIAAAQTRFGRAARLSRIDIRLVAGTDRMAWQRSLDGALPAGATWAAADDALQRVSNLSRAYRVNLGVLAGVALLVGGFLVYSVVSLSVTQRLPQLALLGVLGLPARQRRALVLAETALLGLAGSLIGLAAGAALAALALRWMGADLGGGYFAGVAPGLHWPWGLLALCLLLGTAAAVAGAWWPARQAEALAPAQALKGLGTDGASAPRARIWPALALLAGGGLLALAPPIAGLPLAAYASVALLLAGGVALVPAAVDGLLRRWPEPQAAVPLLALRRAHFARGTAGATVAGVVASLALCVAITVMVTSFRDAVIVWLDSVLPADLYLRVQGGGERSVLPADLPARAAALPGVQRIAASRQRALLITPQQPPVTLLARPIDADDPGRQLPLLAPPLAPAAAGAALDAWVSEPAAALHGWKPGDRLTLPLDGIAGAGPQGLELRVRGVWRDYARQFGAIAIDLADYQRATGDRQLNDLAVWLAPGAAPAQVARALQDLGGQGDQALPLETASTTELRRMSLRIFDRSFAVTLYLQAVAIGVGLVGVAASLSAQVLARRKEFGLLSHLGLTRRQIMALVALEAGAWLLAGALIGLALGLAMAVVLVQVINPQSFHWSMPLAVPGGRLAALAAAVVLCGALTALWAARRAAGRQAVLAVKEDW
ncbi:MAG: ABC transporter permease [Burkholderiaceae bacterium]|nr:ABC transporter permease [Burkholderiaceae bacterium]